jgi:hypothetical protein
MRFDLLGDRLTSSLLLPSGRWLSGHLRSAKLKKHIYSIVHVQRCQGTPTPQEWKPVSSGQKAMFQRTWSCLVLDRPRSKECQTLLKLPRKEVIQPHLPVRLPCYDFTPITDPTLDACLSYELAQRLQVLPTFVV